MKQIAILVAALGLAFGVTIPKLYKMCQIRGWIAGATITSETITQKWHQTPDLHPSGRHAYWVSWSTTDIQTVGGHRINVDAEYWNRLHVGDPLEVVRLSGSRWPALRDGIFASSGNFVFDGILLTAEIATAIAMILQLIRRRSSAESSCHA